MSPIDQLFIKKRVIVDKSSIEPAETPPSGSLCVLPWLLSERLGYR